VLLNGQPVLSCLLPVEDVAGQQVTTLEGISGDGALHPVQQAFFDEYAIQCGYCTPGMIMTSVALLNQTPHPERAQILEALTGNFCRCTGYEPIVRAIQEAARRSDGQD
jgi:carbon-monoxide dehydrogenase small subunit